MNIDNLPVSVYFHVEDYDYEDVKDLPGANEDDICDWDAMVRKVVEEHFREQCKNFLPLLSSIEFTSISIGIDVIGLDSGMASFYKTPSKNEAGHYSFSVSREVLTEYLKKNQDIDFVLSPVTEYMWEHELIHLLDYKNLNEFGPHEEAIDILEILIYYLLSFRDEGIANLWFYMNHQGPIKDPVTARNTLNENIESFDSVQWEDESIFKQNAWEVMQTYAFYSVGPWMVLHALCSHENPEMSFIVRELADKIENKKPIDKNIMIQIVQQSLLSKHPV